MQGEGEQKRDNVTELTSLTYSKGKSGKHKNRGQYLSLVVKVGNSHLKLLLSCEIKDEVICLTLMGMGKNGGIQCPRVWFLALRHIRITGGTYSQCKNQTQDNLSQKC